MQAGLALKLNAITATRWSRTQAQRNHCNSLVSHVSSTIHCTVCSFFELDKITDHFFEKSLVALLCLARHGVHLQSEVIVLIDVDLTQRFFVSEQVRLNVLRIQLCYCLALRCSLFFTIEQAASPHVGFRDNRASIHRTSFSSFPNLPCTPKIFVIASSCRAWHAFTRCSLSVNLPMGSVGFRTLVFLCETSWLVVLLHLQVQVARTHWSRHQKHHCEHPS